MNSCLRWFIGIGTAELDVLKALTSSECGGFFLNMIPLLEHPNTDIGNQVVEVIHEIIHDEEGFVDQEEVEIVSEIAFKCIKADLFALFCKHAQSLQKEDPDDNQAVYKVFQVIEDCLDISHQADRVIEQAIQFYESLNGSKFMEFLVQMFLQDPKLVKSKSLAAQLTPGDYANRLYAAELAATILQLSAMDLKHENTQIAEAVNKLWKNSLEGSNVIESILISISPYKARDPVDSDEQEYLFNLFDCLAALLLNSAQARKSFSSDVCEGFQLFTMFLKEVNVARIRAIQIVDYVLAPEDTADLASKFINTGGLKVVSPILMGKGTGKLLQKYPKLLLSIDQDEGHICAIVASLFKNVPVDSSAYFRLLTKFVENSGEKFLRLIELHQKYSEKLEMFDKNHKIVHDEIDGELLLDRMNAGLFVLQQIDICLLVLSNSLQVLSLIENNPVCREEIEKDLFDAVLKEAERVFKVDPSVLERVKSNVKQFVKELDEKNSILIVPFLKQNLN